MSVIADDCPAFSNLAAKSDVVAPNTVAFGTDLIKEQIKF